MNAISNTATAPVCANQRQHTNSTSAQAHSRSFNLDEELALIASLYPDEADDLYLNFRTVHAYRKSGFTDNIASYNMYVRIGDLKQPKGRRKVMRWVERNLGKHYNCFFARNPVINKKRNSASRTWEVAVITSFAIDLDGVHPDMALKLVRQAGYPDPTMIVRSGIRGAHAYWFLEVPLANTTESQDLLAAFVLESRRRIPKSDHRVRDPIRILRALGGLNLKRVKSANSTIPSHKTNGNKILHWTGAKHVITDLLDVSPDEVALLESQYQAVISSIQERQVQQAEVLQWVREGVGPFSWKSENSIPSAVKTLDGALQYMNDRDMEQRIEAIDEYEERWIEDVDEIEKGRIDLGPVETSLSSPPLSVHVTGLAEATEQDSSREIDLPFIDSIVPRLVESSTRNETLPEVVQVILRSYPEHDRTKRLLQVFHHRFYVLNKPYIASSEKESLAEFERCWDRADKTKKYGTFTTKVLANMVTYELAHEQLPGKRHARRRFLADFVYSACRLEGFKPNAVFLAYQTMAEILGCKNKGDAHKAMQLLRDMKLVARIQNGRVWNGKARASLWSIPKSKRNPSDRRGAAKAAA